MVYWLVHWHLGRLPQLRAYQNSRIRLQRGYYFSNSAIQLLDATDASSLLCFSPGTYSADRLFDATDELNGLKVRG